VDVLAQPHEILRDRMTPFSYAALWIVPVLVIAAGYLLVRRMNAGRRGLDRLFAETGAPDEQPSGDAASAGFFRRWLYLAGYRQPNAAEVFVWLEIAVVTFALSVVFVLYQTGLSRDAEQSLLQLPPELGKTFLPLIYLGPWLMLLIVASAPLLVVRRARRERVEKVEQDLPLSLELLATLGEAGLGFDAALARLLESLRDDRPLAREFRTYQADLLAGRTRVESLRRLARRLDISSVSILVSALVQAEQMGSGIAQALRRQADDLRDRRRERANAFAMALPVKRMFPLVVCFMPGIFIWTLGPFFVQLFQIADNLMRVRRM
jgi:tight adherence protein C